MAGAQENVGFHASSLETLRQMVGEGMGMTLMPQLAVPAQQSGQDRIRYLPFADPKPSRQVGMLLPQGKLPRGDFYQFTAADSAGDGTRTEIRLLSNVIAWQSAINLLAFTTGQVTNISLYELFS